MEIRVFTTSEELARAAARRVAETLRQRPDVVLGLPAGRTPIGVYAELRRLAVAGQADFSRATAFALDEFVGIDHTHPASFHRFIREHLIEHVGFAIERFHGLKARPMTSRLSAIVTRPRFNGRWDRTTTAGYRQ